MIGKKEIYRIRLPYNVIRYTSTISYRNREISTTDDEYVRWTQWIFIKLFHAGLAAQSEVSVNWCPALGTYIRTYISIHIS